MEPGLAQPLTRCVRPRRAVSTPRAGRAQMDFTSRPMKRSGAGKAGFAGSRPNAARSPPGTFEIKVLQERTDQGDNLLQVCFKQPMTAIFEQVQVGTG